MIESDIIRGNTETIILARLYEHDSYGYEISKTVSELSDGMFQFKEATLYTAFKRLLGDGLIRSYWGADSPSARRKYYSITEDGTKVYLQKRSEWQKTKTILDKLIETGSEKQ